MPTTQEPKQLKREVATFKRRRLREEASHLFFKHGYEATTLDAVAERLHVTKPFIYSYYKNKGELLAEICQIGIQLSLEALDWSLSQEGSATSRLKLLIDKTAHIVIENQEYIVVYQREEKNLDPEDARRIRDMRHDFDHRVATLLEEGARKGEFEIGDPSMTANSINGLISWISNWYRPGGKWSPTEVVMHTMSLVLRMVGPHGV